MDVSKLKFDSIADAIPAILAIIAIPLTYSITAGMAIGFISYVVCSICTKQIKKLTAGSIVLMAIFVIYFIMS